MWSRDWSCMSHPKLRLDYLRGESCQYFGQHTTTSFSLPIVHPSEKYRSRGCTLYDSLVSLSPRVPISRCYRSTNVRYRVWYVSYMYILLEPAARFSLLIILSCSYGRWTRDGLNSYWLELCQTLSTSIFAFVPDISYLWGRKSSPALRVIDIKSLAWHMYYVGWLGIDVVQSFIDLRRLG